MDQGGQLTTLCPTFTAPLNSIPILLLPMGWRPDVTCYARQGAGSRIVTLRLQKPVRLARRAVELGKDDAVALGTAGMAMSFVVGDHYYGKALTDRAVALNPNLAKARGASLAG